MSLGSLPAVNKPKKGLKSLTHLVSSLFLNLLWVPDFAPLARPPFCRDQRDWLLPRLHLHTLLLCPMACGLDHLLGCFCLDSDQRSRYQEGQRTHTHWCLWLEDQGPHGTRASVRDLMLTQLGLLCPPGLSRELLCLQAF